MKKTSEINAEYKALTVAEYDGFIAEYSADERAGIQKLVENVNKKKAELEAEKERMYKMFEFERKYSDMEYICGIDEVGRGPFAGPVVAGAVILPKDCDLLYLNDSKQLSEKMREELYDKIMENAIATGIGYSSAEMIDEIGIQKANYSAMRDAIKELKVKPDLLLNDAVIIPEVDIKQVKIIHGDALSASIAAASIIAKVTRDRLMVEYAKVIPEYGFEANKGYGSAKHREAIKKYGPSPIHRRSFIKNYI